MRYTALNLGNLYKNDYNLTLLDFAKFYEPVLLIIHRRFDILIVESYYRL